MHSKHHDCDIKVGVTGFETPPQSSGNTALLERGDAESDALADAARRAVDLLAGVVGIDAAEARRVTEARDGLLAALAVVLS